MAFNTGKFKPGDVVHPLLVDSKGNPAHALTTLEVGTAAYVRLIKRGIAPVSPGGTGTVVFLPEKLYLHPAAGATANWTSQTAAAIDAAFTSMEIGDGYDWHINNDSANVVTVAGGVGVTATTGSLLTVAANTGATYRFAKTAAGAYALTCRMQGVVCS